MIKEEKKISRSLLAKTREIYVLYLRKILMGRNCRGSSFGMDETLK